MAHIVILGGGFGGTRAALGLSRKLDAQQHQVTLIDKNDSHLFLPSLYEVASARKGREGGPYFISLRNTICLPYGQIFRNSKVNFIQGEVMHVGLEDREVHLASGTVVRYDWLVIALGSEVATFGIPGVLDYAYQFKRIDDGLMIHSRIHKYFQEMKDKKRKTPLKISICGAGFTGIELAGELAESIKHIRKFHRLKGDCIQISIFEGAPNILPMVSDPERELIRKRLERLRIRICENTPIREITSAALITKDGVVIDSDMTIWTAGIKASSFIEQIGGLHLDERHRVKVNEFLQAVDQPNVFALGDNTCIVDLKTEKPIPGLGYAAAEQGRVLADNISRMFKGESMRPYMPEYSAWIAPIGGKYVVAHIGRNLTVAGFFGWLIKLFVDMRYFIKTLGLWGAGELMFQELRIFTQND